MKRDMDLIRQVLLLLEEKPAGPVMSNDLHASIENVETIDLLSHLELMTDAGLIKARVTWYTAGNGGKAVINSITWEGYEFLEAAREGSIWEKAKRAAGALSFEVLKHFLITAAKNQAVKAIAQLSES